jgi:hypothetical protein
MPWKTQYLAEDLSRKIQRTEMSKKTGKSLVIDACIARSASETNHPISSACRECLKSILKHSHRMVITKEISREWRKHQSPFAQEWLKTMFQRKRLHSLKPSQVENIDGLMDFIDTLEFQKEREDAYKDIHLIEAAIASDKRIISSDEKTARKFFSAATETVPIIGDILWANPVKPEESVADWIAQGTPLEPERTLKAFRQRSKTAQGSSSPERIG